MPPAATGDAVSFGGVRRGWGEPRTHPHSHGMGRTGLCLARAGDLGTTSASYETPGTFINSPANGDHPAGHPGWGAPVFWRSCMDGLGHRQQRAGYLGIGGEGMERESYEQEKKKIIRKSNKEM